MDALPAMVALLGVVAWVLLLARDRESPSLIRIVIEAASAQVVLATLAAVALVSAGAFRPGTAALTATALPLALLLTRGGAAGGGLLHRRLATAPEAGVLVLLCLLVPAARPSLETLRMAGDAGVYSSRAIHHLHGGGFEGRVPLRGRLQGGLREVFDRDNMSGGAYLPGTYLEAPDSDRFSFRFLPGWPMAMALWAGFFGLPRLFDVLPFLYALAVALFALLLQRHATRRVLAAGSLLLFASSPLLLFLARYSTAEVFLIFLFLFILHFAGDGSWRGTALASAGMLLLAVSHPSTFLYAPLLLLTAAYAHRAANFRLAAFSATAFACLLAGLPLSRLLSPHYVRDVYAYAFAFLPVPDPGQAGHVLVGWLYLLGLAISVVALRRAEPRSWAGFERLLPRAMPVLIALVAAWTAWRGYQLGWTDRFAAPALAGTAWSYRTRYADGGWASLAHLNIVSMTMATSVVGLPLVLALAWRRGRDLVSSPMRALLLAAVLLTVAVYTFGRFDTPFNYYASRYFAPVLLPSTMLLLGLLPRDLGPGRIAVLLGLAAGLAFNLPYDVAMARSPAAHGPLRFVRDVAEGVEPGRVLFVPEGPFAFQTLAVPLASLRGTLVVRVARSGGVPARCLVERYVEELGLRKAAILSRVRPSSGSYREVRLTERDLVGRILYPTEAVAHQRRYFLFPYRPATDCSPPRAGR